MRTSIFLLLLCFAYNTLAQSELSPFYDESARLWGYKNAEGDIALDAQYKLARPFNEGVAFVKICDSKSGPCFFSFIDFEGKSVFIVPRHYTVFSANQYLSEGLIAVFDNHKGKFGYINIKGDEVLSFEYEMAFNFSEGKALVVDCNAEKQENNVDEINLDGDCEMLVINRSQEVIIEIPDTLFHRWNSTVAHSPLEFHEGLLKVIHKETGKSGFIDPEGRLVIPCIYDVAGNFSEGLAFAGELKNTYSEQPGGNVIGYVDRHNKFQIQLPDKMANLENGCFFYGFPFRQGKARMSISENDGDCANWGHVVIDNEGTIVVNDWR